MINVTSYFSRSRCEKYICIIARHRVFQSTRTLSTQKCYSIFRKRRIHAVYAIAEKSWWLCKNCLLAIECHSNPKLSPTIIERRRYFRGYVIWNRSSRPPIPRRRATLDSSLLSTGSTNEFSCSTWTRGESRNFTRNAIRELAPGVCRNRRGPDRGPTPPPCLVVTIVPYVTWNQSILAVFVDIPTLTFYTSFRRARFGLVRNV